MLLQKGKAPLYSKGTPKTHGTLCPTMDLIAFVNESSSSLKVFRSVDWDPLPSFSALVGGKSTGALVWKKNGKALAIGMEDGTVNLVQMEQQQEDCPPKTWSHSQSAISSLHWASCALPDLGRSDLLLVSTPKSMREQDCKLDILVIADCLGQVSFIGGVHSFLLATLSCPEVPLSHVFLSQDFTWLVLVSQSTQTVFTYCTRVLQESLLVVHRILRDVDVVVEELNQTKSLLTQVRKLWEDMLLTLKKLFSNVHLEENESLHDLLFGLLTRGPCHAELDKMFSANRFPLHVLEKFAKLAETNSNAMIRLLEVDITRSMERLVFVLGNWMGILPDLAQVNIQHEWVQHTVSFACLLLRRSQFASSLIRKTKEKYVAFSLWLSACLGRFQGHTPELHDPSLNVLFSLLQQGGLEQTHVSQEIGLVGFKLRDPPQEILQSWDRDFAKTERSKDEEEASIEVEDSLAGLLNVFTAQFKQVEEIVASSLSSRYTLWEDPRPIACDPTQNMVVEEGVLAYLTENAQLIVETFDYHEGWRILGEVDKVHQVTYFGKNSSDFPSVFPDSMLVVERMDSQVQILSRDLHVVKQIALNTSSSRKQFVASGPRGTLFVLNAGNGQFQLWDVSEQDDDDDDDEL